MRQQRGGAVLLLERSCAEQRQRGYEYNPFQPQDYEDNRCNTNEEKGINVAGSLVVSGGGAKVGTFVAAGPIAFSAGSMCRPMLTKFAFESADQGASNSGTGGAPPGK